MKGKKNREEEEDRERRREVDETRGRAGKGDLRRRKERKK